MGEILLTDLYPIIGGNGVILVAAALIWFKYLKPQAQVREKTEAKLDKVLEDLSKILEELNTADKEHIKVCNSLEIIKNDVKDMRNK